MDEMIETTDVAETEVVDTVVKVAVAAVAFVAVFAVVNAALKVRKLWNQELTYVDAEGQTQTIGKFKDIFKKN